MDQTASLEIAFQYKVNPKSICNKACRRLTLRLYHYPKWWMFGEISYFRMGYDVFIIVIMRSFQHAVDVKPKMGHAVTSDWSKENRPGAYLAIWSDARASPTFYCAYPSLSAKWSMRRTCGRSFLTYAICSAQCNPWDHIDVFPVEERCPNPVKGGYFEAAAAIMYSSQLRLTPRLSAKKEAMMIAWRASTCSWSEPRAYT